MRRKFVDGVSGSTSDLNLRLHVARQSFVVRAQSLLDHRRVRIHERTDAARHAGSAGENRVHPVQERIVRIPQVGPFEFTSNYVSSTKYTVLNFVPKNLMLQFQRVANLYFLAVATLASISSISPMSGTTFWFPLAVVLGFSAAKDAHEDLVRNRADVEENGRTTEVYDSFSGEFECVQWRDVTVGSLVRISAADERCSLRVPCDLVLLASSSADGTCFLETADLDGETNLKMRRAVKATHAMFATRGEEGGDERSLQLRVRELRSLALEVRCGPPDGLLYDFEGRITVNGQTTPLSGGISGGQLLQRSTKLKNTKWCLGVAVYVGNDTKIQQNATDPPNKRSSVEHTLNTFILWLFLFLFVLCVSGAVGMSVWRDSVGDAWYLVGALQASRSASGAPGFFSYLILLSMIVPISLYVSIELVKGVTAVIISYDNLMLDPREGIATTARSAGLCEDLGRVSLILSDKTGTLTRNIMEFKRCSVGGIEYGLGHTEVERAMAQRTGLPLPEEPKPAPGTDADFVFRDDRLTWGRWQREPSAGLIESFLLNLALNHTVQVDYERVGPVDQPSNGAASPGSAAGVGASGGGGGGGRVIYQAESPDEECFVTAAKNLGVFFCRRTTDRMTVRCYGIDGAGGPESVDTEWEVIGMNPFDSYRKRSSVLVQGTDGALFLLVKGADSSVLPFVDRARCGFMEETLRQISDFGSKGLRTLVFAAREVSADEAAAWRRDVEAASLLMDGREAALRRLAARLEENHAEAGRESALVDASTRFTPSLTLSGVTALEDKLQDGLGSCLAQLAQAGIRIWMLTGDKMETAINVAFATQLFTGSMHPLLQLSRDALLEQPIPENVSELEAALADALSFAARRDADGLKRRLAALPDVKSGDGGSGTLDELSAEARSLASSLAADEVPGRAACPVPVDFCKLEGKMRDLLLRLRIRRALDAFVERTTEGRTGGYGMVIDGSCLQTALSGASAHAFLTVAVRCQAVVCCRVTPSQKARVARLVRQQLVGEITLAVGDGANDVSMIQVAHVGVGIRGKEGQQAALASDYALAQFSHLERLLLVHGRWSYNRISTMVCYFFYKNITYAMTLFWFGIWSAFSAQPLFDDAYQSLFNLIFTSLPVMTFALLDRDVEAATVLRHPRLYAAGHDGTAFSTRRFALFVLGAVAHSLTIFFLCAGAMDMEKLTLGAAGTTVLSCVILTVTTVLALHTCSVTWLHCAVYAGSVAVWLAFLLGYHSVPLATLARFNKEAGVHGVVFRLLPSPSFWLTCVITVAAACLPVAAYKFLAQTFRPSLLDLCRLSQLRPRARSAEPAAAPSPEARAEGGESGGGDRRCATGARSPPGPGGTAWVPVALARAGAAASVGLAMVGVAVGAALLLL